MLPVLVFRLFRLIIRGPFGLDDDGVDDVDGVDDGDDDDDDWSATSLGVALSSDIARRGG